MERDKSQPYKRPYYLQLQPNKVQVFSSKNDSKIPFKKFINAPWEVNMKQKDTQMDMKEIPNNLLDTILNQITSYYYLIYEMPHNPK